MGLKSMSGWKRGLKLTFSSNIWKRGGLKSIFFSGTYLVSQCLEKGGLYHRAYPSPSHNEYPPPPTPICTRYIPIIPIFHRDQITEVTDWRTEGWRDGRTVTEQERKRENERHKGTETKRKQVSKVPFLCIDGHKSCTKWSIFTWPFSNNVFST